MQKKKKTDFYVAVVGGRDFDDYDRLRNALDILLAKKCKTHDVFILSGKAKGADTLGEQYATDRGLEVKEFPADWKRNGKAAGHIRNAEMCTQSDAVLAFWDGVSRGTNGMINLAKKHGKMLKVMRY